LVRSIYSSSLSCSSLNLCMNDGSFVHVFY
jgi:hypothetical protein